MRRVATDLQIIFGFLLECKLQALADKRNLALHVHSSNYRQLDGRGLGGTSSGYPSEYTSGYPEHIQIKVPGEHELQIAEWRLLMDTLNPLTESRMVDSLFYAGESTLESREPFSALVSLWRQTLGGRTF